MDKNLLISLVGILILVRCALSADELVHGEIRLKYTVEKAPEWTELFRKTTGWTGADGIFSYDDPKSDKILFVFSDTWIGEVDSKSRQRKTMKMINNSMAVLEGIDPQKSRINFLWNKEENISAFIPAKKKSWYWLQDGFIYKDHFYNFPMCVVKNPNGSEGFQFRAVAVDILKIPLKGGSPLIDSAKNIRGKLFTRIDGHEMYFGAGVLKNAGDGYIYVYGRLHKDFRVQLTVARIKPQDIDNEKAWRFWDGMGWNSDINKSKSLGEGGPELSVTRMASGPLKDKYVLVSMPVSREVFVRIGDSPQGPFGSRHVIYRTPDQDEIEGIYTYNAKAHPVISKAGELLISYNVNAAKLHLHKNAEIYRPRFIRLKFIK